MNAVQINNLFLFGDEHGNEREDSRRLRIERVLIRQRTVYRLSDEEFRTNFRISKHTFERILHELTPHLIGKLRSDGICVEKKVAATIRFLAKGSYQKGVGNDFIIRLSQPAISKVLNEVIECMHIQMCSKYVKFPITTEEKTRISDWFQTRFKIPNVIGMIDGTHIGIFPPAINNEDYPEFAYVNRKKFHSINTQIIVDHEYRILNLNAKFPGSTHDSHIWRMSAVRQHLCNTYRNSKEWLLGDSGYPLEPWLLTPFSNPNNDNYQMFNNAHSKARSTVERAIGVLKGRWRCLCKQRNLHYKPPVCSKIINACATLHNICIQMDDYLPVDEILVDNYDDNVIHFGNTMYNVGDENRRAVIAYMNNN